MIIGVPREIKEQEYRVALLPSGTWVMRLPWKKACMMLDISAFSSLLPTSFGQTNCFTRVIGKPSRVKLAGLLVAFVSASTTSGPVRTRMYLSA